MKTIQIIGPLDPYRPDVAVLLEQADDYLLSRYPAELCFLDDATALAKPNVTLLGAVAGDTLVGMGAIKRRSDDGDYGEVKRVFVTARARGTGVGKQLMQALEMRAWAQGISRIRLETGVEQPEAVKLYEKLGYRVRGPFGDYPANELSIFMEKCLDKE